MKKAFYTIMVFTFLSTNLYSQKNEWLGKKVKIEQLETRIDSFQMIQNDKVVGHWVWETQINEDEIIFKDESVLTGVVNETFILKFDRQKLNTAIVDMKMWTDADTLKVDINRTTNKDIKASFNLSGRSRKKTIVDTIFQKEVVLRAEVFALLPSLSNYENLNESIETFFMDSGKTATMNLKYLGEEEVTVKAGKFNTYKLSFEGEKQISNIIYLRKDYPRRIIKVEVVGQPLTIELVKL
ncbi:hypothetical protein GCM10011531_27020 [Aquaticitalea lipolytica]|uniref:Uncharacterized protein n=1 Tax=Aquaticitalea lipolytica TaxID=1247562 RepID=A0A8J2XJF7_9FLAO|nr:hypothetical protein [Aquaticitalea lipolytica]GFZ93639.1 hypothetical protein GCM10011531_27020 [Aquaticitalea lipolytica]